MEYLGPCEVSIGFGGLQALGVRLASPNRPKSSDSEDLGEVKKMQISVTKYELTRQPRYLHVLPLCCPNIETCRLPMTAKTKKNEIEFQWLQIAPLGRNDWKTTKQRFFRNEKQIHHKPLNRMKHTGVFSAIDCMSPPIGVFFRNVLILKPLGYFQGTWRLNCVRKKDSIRRLSHLQKGIDSTNRASSVVENDISVLSCNT